MRFLIKPLLALSLLTTIWACAPSPEVKADNIESQTTNWYVYRDSASPENKGYWTNLIPKEAADMITCDMADKSNPHSGETAIKMTIKFLPPNWAGLAVACEPDYYGKTPSDSAWNLQGARKLVFWARGETGEEHIQVKFAAFGKEQYGDSSKTPIATPWISLTKTWERYEIDLTIRDYDLHRVINPFLVVSDKAHNQKPEGITFYLDDIYFVMPK